MFQVFYGIEEIIQELSDMDINILKKISMVENYLNIEIKSVKCLKFFATTKAH